MKTTTLELGQTAVFLADVERTKDNNKKWVRARKPQKKQDIALTRHI